VVSGGRVGEMHCGALGS
jgi:hypothetical protein